MSSTRYLSCKSRTWVSTSRDMSLMAEMVRRTNFRSSRVFGTSSRSFDFSCKSIHICVLYVYATVTVNCSIFEISIGWTL